MKKPPYPALTNDPMAFAAAVWVGLVFCLPRMVGAQVLIAPIDKTISMSIGQYGSQNGDLALLSLSPEECSSCSSYPLLAFYLTI